MNLKSKFWFWSAALSAPVLMLGGVALWNLIVQGRAMHAATAEFDVADRAKATSVQVGWLRDSLRGTDGRTFFDLKYFGPIEIEVQKIVHAITTASSVDDGDSRAERQLAAEIPSLLEKATALVTAKTSAPTTPADVASHLDQLQHSLAAASTLGPEAARRHIIVAEAGVSQRFTVSLLWLSILLVISAAIHYKQYRALVRPLLWLRDDMQRSAKSEYRQPVRPRGEYEFKEMALYFNGLAKELAELYRGLEEKVIARSRELVRSERLASVGFLAAGVAHEINNPLSVISGYAELSTKNMRRVLIGPGGGGAGGSDDEINAKAEAEALSSVLEAQGIIREEAFRCKEITSRLLSLARGGTDGRERLHLNQVAEQVVTLTKGLRNYRDRRVVLEFDPAASFEVQANATEMKQVLLNLTVNALEAASAESGEVRIGGHHTGEWVECFVQDNGKGMSQETLEQIFEPFFTAKRGVGEPGTGLGLSITHAIVENHGGRIRAESAGPGRGSRFTFRLPAVNVIASSNGRRTLMTG